MNKQGMMGMAEVDRLGVIKKIVEKRLRQRQAAKQPGIGVRQVKRLVKRYRKQGALGLVSRRRGRSPNNTISADRRQELNRGLLPGIYLQRQYRRSIVVTAEQDRRVVNGIEIMPYPEFLELLHGGDIV